MDELSEEHLAHPVLARSLDPDAEQLVILELDSQGTRLFLIGAAWEPVMLLDEAGTLRLSFGGGSIHECAPIDEALGVAARTLWEQGA